MAKENKAKDSFFWLGLVILILGCIGLAISIIPFYGAISSPFEGFLFVISFLSLIIAIFLKKRKTMLIISIIPIIIGFVIGTIQLLFFVDLHNIATAPLNNSNYKTEVKESYTLKLLKPVKEGSLYVLKGTLNAMKGILNILKDRKERKEQEYYEQHNTPMDTTNNPFFQNRNDSTLIKDE